MNGPYADRCCSSRGSGHQDQSEDVNQVRVRVAADPKPAPAITIDPATVKTEISLQCESRLEKLDPTALAP